MAKKTENWWDEEAERLNTMGVIAEAAGRQIEVTSSPPPPLKPDGSLDQEIKPTSNEDEVEPDSFEADLEQVANEFGVDKETLRVEYERRFKE